MAGKAPLALERPLRAVIYARYSTTKQTQKSLDDQVALCRAHCEREGWQIDRVLTDAELTGYSDVRPGYQELLASIESGAVDVVVAENLERISRDSEHSARFSKLCRFHDVRIMTLIDGEGTSLNIGLKSLMSGALLESIAAQAHRGMKGNVLAGKNAGGKSYGYDIPRDTRGDRIIGALAIVPEEAEVVRRILTEYASGKPPSKIAADLNRDGIASPSGDAWRQNTIYGNAERGTGILNNQLYIGVRIWNRHEYRRHPVSQKRVSRLRPTDEWLFAAVPELRIVEDDLWDAVQRRQAGLRKPKAADVADARTNPAPGMPRRPRYLLSGLLFCGCCDGKLTIAGVGDRKRYYCANAKEMGPAVCPGMPGLLRTEAERTVLAGITRDLMRPAAVDAFRKAVAGALGERSGSAQDETETLRKRLRQVEKEIENGTKAIMAGLQSAAVSEALQQAEASKRRITDRIAGLETPLPELPDDLADRYAALVRDLPLVLSDPEMIQPASDILRVLIDRIVVSGADDDGHLLDIQGNLGRILESSAPERLAGLGSEFCSLGLVAGA